jgi:hypothetical protein
LQEIKDTIMDSLVEQRTIADKLKNGFMILKIALFVIKEEI